MRLQALITDLDGAVVAPCTLANVSASGAKLTLKTPVEVPDTFTLVLSKGGAVRRQCEVVWRTEKEIGVQFVLSQAAEAGSAMFVRDALSRIGIKH